MRERLQKFIDLNALTAARFSDEIGVQRSAVSHILSGRNNPGFDFIQKILRRYPQLNAEWLIMGAGVMYKEVKQASLFDNTAPQADIFDQPLINSEKTPPLAPNKNVVNDEQPAKYGLSSNIPASENLNQVSKIVFFYSDNTFTIHYPSKQ